MRFHIFDRFSVDRIGKNPLKSMRFQIKPYRVDGALGTKLHRKCTEILNCRRKAEEPGEKVLEQGEYLHPGHNE